MGVTHDPQSQSVSASGLYDARAWVELPGRTIASLMGEFGDSAIELLKLDVGGEYEILRVLDPSSLKISVSAIQLHHTGSVRDAARLVGDLVRQGYMAVGCRPMLKVTFVRHDLIEDGSTVR